MDDNTIIIETEFEAGGDAHRVIEALKAMYPGFTSSAIVEAVAQSVLESVFTDNRNFAGCAGTVEEYLEKKAKAEQKRERENQRRRKKRVVRNDARNLRVVNAA